MDEFASSKPLILSVVITRVAEPSHFDGSGSRAPKTGGYGSGSNLKKRTHLDL